MKISVKLLQGAECFLDVSPDMTLLELKLLIETNLNVPVSEQKLLLMGRPLIDNKKTLKECSIPEGIRLNLLHNPSLTTSIGFRELLMTFLLNHMPANNANRVFEEFMKEYNRNIKSLSLDDLERIAKTRLKEDEKKAGAISEPADVENGSLE